MNVELIMFKDNGERKAFSLDPGQTVIGRGEGCDLRIPLPEISRKHAAVIVSEKAATLRDMSSANGTYVNNRKISEQELSAGDHIVIGPVVFTIRIDGMPDEIRPVQTRLETRASSPSKPKPAARPAAAQLDVSEDVDLFDDDDEDPISALEALAATDDTTAIDLGDSALGEDESGPS